MIKSINLIIKNYIIWYDSIYIELGQFWKLNLKFNPIQTVCQKQEQIQTKLLQFKSISYLNWIALIVLIEWKWI